MSCTSELINSVLLKVHQSYDIITSDDFLQVFKKLEKNEKHYYHEFSTLESNLKYIISKENEIKEIINKEKKLEEELISLKSQNQ